MKTIKESVLVIRDKQDVPVGIVIRDDKTGHYVLYNVDEMSEDNIESIINNKDAITNNKDAITNNKNE